MFFIAFFGFYTVLPQRAFLFLFGDFYILLVNVLDRDRLIFLLKILLFDALVVG